METRERGVDQLRKEIEFKAGRQMHTPKDFDFLVACIFEDLHEKVSPTTLKRLWGYLSEEVTPRVYTLDILARYAGYDNWASFSQGDAKSTAEQESPTIIEKNIKLLPMKWFAFAVIALLVVGLVVWTAFRQPTAINGYLLKQGDKFATYSDYLHLFGIQDTTAYWGCVLPHHPNIVIWGPEYHHPHWQNDGDRSQLLPTITEFWAPEGIDTAMIIMRNRDKYNHELRNNEVRITFMKNLNDTGYVFLGVYRLSLSLSDTTRCVWERVAEECDLANLGYLEELRN